ncbi:MAG: hypothetical protein RL584_1620 [Pseudomonadota bacterium]|jgi:antitoxin ParD1/3/4
MSTMNISLPDSMKSFVDEQVSQRGYGTSSEYVRELIRKDQERQSLRSLLLAGATSKPGKPVSGPYFEMLRARVLKATEPPPKKTRAKA